MSRHIEIIIIKATCLDLLARLIRKKREEIFKHKYETVPNDNFTFFLRCEYVNLRYEASWQTFFPSPAVYYMRTISYRKMGGRNYYLFSGNVRCLLYMCKRKLNSSFWYRVNKNDYFFVWIDFLLMLDFWPQATERGDVIP